MEPIIRNATDDEKKDMVELTGRHKDVFLDKVAKKRLEFDKKHLPFCARCAKIDFKDRGERIVQEKMRQVGAELTQEEMNKVIENVNINLEDYGKLDRFEIIDEAEVTQQKFMDGQWIPYKTGVCINYKCKVRGCGTAVEVPIAIYNERANKKANGDEKHQKI